MARAPNPQNLKLSCRSLAVFIGEEGYAQADGNSRWLTKSGVGVEKVRDRNVFPAAMIAVAELLFSPQLRGGFHGGCGRLAEEPH